MGDDAVGPHVVARLVAGFEFPPGVAVVDVGTPGLDLTPYLAGLRAAVVVDAVRGETPGEVRVIRKGELVTWSVPPRLSPHDPGLLECLMALELAGRAPADVTLVGVAPASVATGTALTPIVAAALPAAVQAVLDELRRLGVPPRPRPQPTPPDLWWERPAAVPR